jgi:RNA polymerase sigma-70 factor (ECF subfamily)
MARISAASAVAVAPDDDALVGSVLAGNQRAFESIMRRHNQRLYRLARATLRDPVEAEDALQDAYLHAYSKLAGYRRDASLATWLSRLVLNECFARMRLAARRNELLPTSAEHTDSEVEKVADQAAGPDIAAMRSQMRALIERRLDELPIGFRVVFVLRCVEEMSVEETAQHLSIPQATVSSRYFRARAMLREALAGDVDFAERDVYEFGGKRCDRIVAAVMSQLPAASICKESP